MLKYLVKHFFLCVTRGSNPVVREVDNYWTEYWSPVTLSLQGCTGVCFRDLQSNSCHHHWTGPSNKSNDRCKLFSTAWHFRHHSLSTHGYPFQLCELPHNLLYILIHCCHHACRKHEQELSWYACKYTVQQLSCSRGHYHGEQTSPNPHTYS